MLPARISVTPTAYVSENSQLNGAHNRHSGSSARRSGLFPLESRGCHSLTVPVFGGYRRSNAGTDKQAVLPVHLNAFLAGHLQYHSFNRGVLQHINPDIR